MLPRPKPPPAATTPPIPPPTAAAPSPPPAPPATPCSLSKSPNPTSSRPCAANSARPLKSRPGEGRLQIAERGEAMLKRIALLVALLLATGAAAQEGPALSGAEGIRNFLRVNETICTGGQPTLEQLAELKAGGVRAVLNLRRPTEKQTMRPGGEPGPYDAAAEAAEAEPPGPRYFNIPVDPDAPTDAQVDEFLTR